jgi:hypothetical protein
MLVMYFTPSYSDSSISPNDEAQAAPRPRTATADAPLRCGLAVPLPGDGPRAAVSSGNKLTKQSQTPRLPSGIPGRRRPEPGAPGVPARAGGLPVPGFVQRCVEAPLYGGLLA